MGCCRMLHTGTADPGHGASDTQSQHRLQRTCEVLVGDGVVTAGAHGRQVERLGRAGSWCQRELALRRNARRVRHGHNHGGNSKEGNGTSHDACTRERNGRKEVTARCWWWGMNAAPGIGTEAANGRADFHLIIIFFHLAPATCGRWVSYPPLPPRPRVTASQPARRGPWEQLRRARRATRT